MVVDDQVVARIRTLGSGGPGTSSGTHSLAVYQLGNNGSARTLLKSWPLTSSRDGELAAVNELSSNAALIISRADSAELLAWLFVASACRLTARGARQFGRRGHIQRRYLLRSHPLPTQSRLVPESNCRRFEATCLAANLATGSARVAAAFCGSRLAGASAVDLPTGDL